MCALYSLNSQNWYIYIIIHFRLVIYLYYMYVYICNMNISEMVQSTKEVIFRRCCCLSGNFLLNSWLIQSFSSFSCCHSDYIHGSCFCNSSNRVAVATNRNNKIHSRWVRNTSKRFPCMKINNPEAHTYRPIVRAINYNC